MNIVLHIVSEWLIFGAMLWFKPTRRLIIGSLIFVTALFVYVHLHRWIGE